LVIVVLARVDVPDAVRLEIVVVARVLVPTTVRSPES